MHISSNVESLWKILSVVVKFPLHPWTMCVHGTKPLSSKLQVELIISAVITLIWCLKET